MSQKCLFLFEEMARIDTYWLGTDAQDVVAFAATVSPLADVQFISARDGEGGASRDSDGFDELDWTVWNRISLWLDSSESRNLTYGSIGLARVLWTFTFLSVWIKTWRNGKKNHDMDSETFPASNESVQCGICIKDTHPPVASPVCVR